MLGKQIVFESKGKVTVQSFEVPTPKADQILLENEYTVVSAGTECANLLDLPNTAGTFPFTPGYCGIGRVIGIGDDIQNVKLGDRVLANFSGHRSHAIQASHRITVVDDERIDTLDAAFVVIAAMSLQGIRKLQIQIGESTMIVGLGILGMFATQLAALDGAIPVIVSDFDPMRRELALQIGADHAFSPDEPDLAQKIKQLTGNRGVDSIVEVTGKAIALQQALTFAAPRGRISLLGCTRIPDAEIDFYKYVHKTGVSLIGAHTFVRPQVDSYPGYWTEQDDFRTLLKFLAAGKLKAKPIISEILSPAHAPELYQRLTQTKNPPLGIVFDWKQL
ncbi:MAG: zinc-binding dehydrogenase [Phycisphaeraceae bacterium JB051]